MNPSELFSVVLVFLHCNVGIGCLEITLDGFNMQCVIVSNCKKSAGHRYNVTGKMVLKVGEKLPNFLIYEVKCPPSSECLTLDGTGSWDYYRSTAIMGCPDNHPFTMRSRGCHRLDERTYGFYRTIGDYYSTRLCKIRALPCERDTLLAHPVEDLRCGAASNELNVSDISTVSRYGYDSSEDEGLLSFEKECRDKRQHAARNGKLENRHPSDSFLMIFGAVHAINMIVFY